MITARDGGATSEPTTPATGDGAQLDDPCHLAHTGRGLHCYYSEGGLWCT